MNSCEGCKYWSEMIAESRAAGVYAMCLHPAMPRDYTRRGCERREVGEPVDIPARKGR